MGGFCLLVLGASVDEQRVGKTQIYPQLLIGRMELLNHNSATPRWTFSKVACVYTQACMLQELAHQGDKEGNRSTLVIQKITQKNPTEAAWLLLLYNKLSATPCLETAVFCNPFKRTTQFHLPFCTRNGD